MLCTACEAIVNRESRPIKTTHIDSPIVPGGFEICRFVHQYSWADLKAAARRGCQICTAVRDSVVKWDSYAQEPRGEPLAEDYWRSFVETRCEKSWDNFSTRDFTVYTTEDKLDYAHGEYSLEPSDWVAPGSINTSSSDSPSSWKSVKEWISTCANNHQCVPDSSAWYPTRLLDLTCPNLSGESFRIIETAEHRLVEHYSALSHCWGGHVPLEATRHNIESLKSGVAVSLLPRTFQDAIAVCRRLGIRYLWIDSLCILQDKDDLSDWKREAVRMYAVYGNSFLTIAASAAINGTKGLFQARDPASLVHYTTNISVRARPWHEEYTKFGEELFERQFVLTDRRLWNRFVEESVLGVRGWVLQERVLSPRTLFFGAGQLLWECKALRACEQYPRMIPHSVKVIQLPKFESISADGKARPGKDIGQAWQNVVNTYSKCNLTKSSDKLVALAGLAKMFTDTKNSVYVAGLWQETLVSDLLWFASGPASRPKEYRAPTWSWASLDGVISPYRPAGNKQYTLKLEEVNVKTDATGVSVLLGAYIQVSGCLKHFDLERNKIGDKWIIHFAGQRLASRPGFLNIYVDEGHKFHNGVAQSLYYVKVMERYYLLLQSSSGRTPAFERIGIIIAAVKEQQVILDAPRKDEALAPCESYEAITHTHKFQVI